MLLADGTRVHSSVVLSNATPHRTFLVCFPIAYVFSCLLHRFKKYLLKSRIWILWYELIFHVFSMQGLVPRDALPEDFLHAIENLDYNSVRSLPFRISHHFRDGTMVEPTFIHTFYCFFFVLILIWRWFEMKVCKSLVMLIADWNREPRKSM